MNSKRMEVSFWRHKSKRAGKAQLYCRITVGGQQKDIGSTGITIDTAHWDGYRITGDDPEAYFKNERIDIMRGHLLAIANDLMRKREVITADKIKRLYFGQPQSVTFRDAFDLYMKDAASDPERKLCAHTLEVYGRVQKKLLSFLSDQKVTNLPAEEFDVLWVKKYRRWMAQLPQRDGRTGHAESYIVKQTQTLKNVLIWARLHKLISDNPLQGLRIKGAEFGDPVFLRQEQFEQLKTYRSENRVLQQTADVFIILCRSGFHYGDLQDMVKQHKTALRRGLDGKLWMMKERIKNEVQIRVPVFEEVQTIVDKYGGWERLPLRPLTKFNQYLKLIAAELKLPESLSSKAGRKTFTDWCFNVRGLTTPSILVLLGRKSSVGLDVYGRPDERRVIAELAESSIARKRGKR